MATLCPGVKYGLSSQQNFGGNKDLIFVKLTDSALRAIEEYLKNQNKFSCHGPTIKFLGNEGQLSFPSVQHINNNNSNNGNPPPTSTTSFNFSMSSTADMEGPGGSFECLQQTAPVSPQAPRGGPQQQVLLEALGSIPYKVRVHANDDVYEATRHRMTIAEENHKNKCTREIKPNQTDIGRKVKLKQSRASALPPIRNNGSSRDLPPSSQHQRDSPVATKQPSSLYNNNINSNNMNNHQSSSMPSSNNSILNSLNNSSSSQNNFSKFSNSSISSSSSNGLSNGVNGLLGSNHVSSSMRPQVNRPSVPDIAKRPIKERLIQLLALRPFKKVELHDRLKKEGVREKNGMTSILKQISFMKDNCYHLNRAMWNEVNEEWPFYTETERQMLKRRKPQNLTPPGSSDGGSSGSGQSPTSTHPGSPPPMITSTSTKRPGYYDNQDGLPTKRQRISHYRKPLSSSTSSAEPMSTSSNNNNSAFQNNSNNNNNSSSVSGNYNQQQQRSPLIVDNNMNQRRPVTDSRDASNMNPRSRESPNMFGNNHNNNTNHSNGTMMNGGNGYYNNNNNYNHGNNNNHHGNLSNGYSNHGNGGAIATMSRNNRACDDDEREDVTLPNNNNNFNNNNNNNNNNKRQRFNHNTSINNSDINSGSTNHYNNHNGNNSNSMSFGVKKTPSPPLVVGSDFNNGHQNPSGNRLNSSRNNSPSLVNGNNYSSRNNNSPPLNGNSARNNSPPLMSNINNSSKFSPSPLAKQQQQQQPQHQNSDDFNGTNNSHSSISSNINNNSKYQKRDVAMVTSSPYSALQERNNGGLASSSVNNNNNVNGKLKSLDNGLVNGNISNSNNNKDARSNKYDSNKVTSSSSSLLLQQQQQQQQNRVARVSPDSQSDVLLQMSANLDARPAPPMSPVANPGEDNGLLDDEPPEAYPDYLQEYTNIENSEQRRRYKADFNADYAEYKNLHRIVEKVSRRFADLEARLKQENAASPRFKEIKKQIVREYYENKKDLEQQKSKRRFQYLHDKLSHIKRLVSEYDQKRMKSAQAAATAQENQQPQTNNNNNNRRRY